MQKRLLFVYILLFSYSGAVAHSIVPHHHHQTQEEAKRHHHHNSAGHSHKDSSKKDKDDDGVYFLIHATNADVVIDNVVIDPGKEKTSSFVVLLCESVIPFSIADHNVFHPPNDERTTLLTILNSRSLRAPPSFII